MLEGQYLDIETNTCKDCLPNCSICQNGDRCDLCDYGFIKSMTTVRDYCEEEPPVCLLEGQYLDEEENECKPCIENCQICQNGD